MTRSRLGLLRGLSAANANGLTALEASRQPEGAEEMPRAEEPGASLADAPLAGKELAPAFLAGERNRLRGCHLLLVELR